ncbi:hypothetical protein LWI29_030786 [Acer saccharum]|uniref:UVR domain-containing protein n=1 Tax=Acer saccharum TaxID=4024 RepID=A0AA39V3H0_ACESA|nr:hypothetical protein LWI29_030786 [Acer saccharum]
MEIDEMDSLFEGMVLFTPSQFAADDPKSESESESSVTPVAAGPTTSEALDENLFSDLTLQTHTLDRDQPSPSTTPTSLTNTKPKVSRKKKRASALRIGYARDYPRLPDDEDPDPDPDEDDTAATIHDASANSTFVALNHTADTIHDASANSTSVALNHTADTIHDASANSTSVALNHTADTIHDASANSTSADTIHDDNFNPHQQFEQLKTLISEKLKRARESAASISSARKDSIQKRRKAADHLHSASFRHSQLQKQLDDACEAEDFEAAQRISDDLAAAENHNHALLLALREAEAHCDAIDSELHNVLQSQIAAEQECASLLDTFSAEAANDADVLLKKTEALSSEEMERWVSSTEALEGKKIQVEIESHLVNEARGVLNNSIEHSIEDDLREKDFLCKKKDDLTDELQKLLALVREKEKEIAENDSKIQVVEQRISDVVSGFQEFQSSIDQNYDKLQSGLSQLDLEIEALSMKKKEIDEFFNEEADKAAKLKELAKVSSSEAQAYQDIVGLRRSLMSSILKSREDKARLAKNEEKLSEDVQMLQQEVSAARASLQELSSTKSSIQQNIASFKQRIFFIDKRAPELEAEKKVAAAARNFKEAARIAAEAKSLSLEKDSIQSEMEKSILELQKLEDDIKDTINRLQETEGLILSKEKEVAMARFQRLLITAGAATAERSAALELGDLEEANLLLTEAEAADIEAKKLQPLYDFKEEDLENLPKHFISMELVANSDRKQLAELAASINLSAA